MRNLRAGLNLGDGEVEIVEDPISDEELTELALAADPDAPVESDAKPFLVGQRENASVLPQWYMPPAISRRIGGWRVGVIVTIVMAFLAIDAVGLCMTYGQVVVA